MNRALANLGGSVFWNVINVQSGGGFDWASAANSLLGVLIGAALTYLITRSFERGRIKDLQLGQAYSLVFAIQKMTDDLLKLDQSIKRARAEAKDAGFEGPLWTILDDVVGFSDSDISIPEEALALVAMTKDVELLLGVQEVQSAHRIYLSVLQTLAEQRRKLESFGLQTAVEGKTVSYGATPEEFAKVAPTIIRLEGLSKSLEEGLPKAVSHARDISSRLGPHLKKYYKFKHFISMSFAVGEEAETEAATA